MTTTQLTTKNVNHSRFYQGSISGEAPALPYGQGGYRHPHAWTLTCTTINGTNGAGEPYTKEIVTLKLKAFNSSGNATFDSTFSYPNVGELAAWEYGYGHTAHLSACPADLLALISIATGEDLTALTAATA